jgi:hypothetical protein
VFLTRWRCRLFGAGGGRSLFISRTYLAASWGSVLQAWSAAANSAQQERVAGLGEAVVALADAGLGGLEDRA